MENYICKSEGNVPDIRTSYWDSSGVYICKSVVNHLRHGNYICKSEENVPDIRDWDSSGIYKCKSIVNHLTHGYYIWKSEGIYLCGWWPFPWDDLLRCDLRSSLRLDFDSFIDWEWCTWWELLLLLPQIIGCCLSAKYSAIPVEFTYVNQ